MKWIKRWHPRSWALSFVTAFLLIAAMSHPERYTTDNQWTDILIVCLLLWIWGLVFKFLYEADQKALKEE